MGYQCICPYCGKKSNSGELLFDFTKYFSDKVLSFFEGCSEEEQNQHLGGFKKLVNAWSEAGVKLNVHRPTFLSEDDVYSLTTQSGNPDDTFISGKLTLNVEKWKRWLVESKKDLPPNAQDDDAKAALEFAADPDSAFATSTANVIDLSVRLFKDGPGEIRFDTIRDENGDIIAAGRRCPRCAERLSYWAGRYPEIVMTVIGSPRISKTTALAACADAFLRPSSNMAIKWQSYGSGGKEDAVGDQTWQSFEDDALKKYRDGVKLEATKTGDKDAIPRFSVKIELPGKKNVVLTVVDIPGEYNQGKGREGVSDSLYKEYAELYQSIDCVWFCTDYAELTLTQNDIENSSDLRDLYGFDENHELADTSQLLVRLNQYSGLFRKSLPTVFILGKSDTIDKDASSRNYRDVLYQDDYQLGTNQPSEKRWIRYDDKCAVINEHIYCTRAFRLRKFLYEKNSQLIGGFERAFPVHTYIATSNYGHSVSKEATPSKPYQCEVPLLWLLAMKGYIRTEEETVQFDPTKDGLSHNNLGMCGKSTKAYVSHNKKQHKLFASIVRFFAGIYEKLTGGD